MYCKHCNINWKEGASNKHTCPKCHKRMYDNSYTQFCARKATGTYDVDGAGNIICVTATTRVLTLKPKLFTAEVHAMQTREQWLQQKQAEQDKEDAYLNEYFKQHCAG